MEEGLLDAFNSKPVVEPNEDILFRELFGVDLQEQFPMSIHDLAKLQGEAVDALRNPGHQLRRKYTTQTLNKLVTKITRVVPVQATLQDMHERRDFERERADLFKELPLLDEEIIQKP